MKPIPNATEIPKNTCSKTQGLPSRRWNHSLNKTSCPSVPQRSSWHTTNKVRREYALWERVSLICFNQLSIFCVSLQHVHTLLNSKLLSFHCLVRTIGKVFVIWRKARPHCKASFKIKPNVWPNLWFASGLANFGLILLVSSYRDLWYGHVWAWYEVFMTCKPKRWLACWTNAASKQ